MNLSIKAVILSDEMSRVAKLQTTAQLIDVYANPVRNGSLSKSDDCSALTGPQIG